MTIVGLVGSLRKRSYNRALLEAARSLLPEGTSLTEASIRDLPLFDQDLETSNYPQAATALKDAIRKADGVFIVVPEFNRGMPGALKNALDWTSRPESEPLVWRDKPVWVVGASSGPRGTVVAQYDVKRTMIYFGAKLMGVPEFYLGNNKEKFDASLQLTDQKTRDHLAKGLQSFVDFVGT